MNGARTGMPSSTNEIAGLRGERDPQQLPRARDGALPICAVDWSRG